MPLKRKQHWATRGYHQYLIDTATKPFTWGEHDCCLHAANAIEAITGVDIADDFRGKYKTQLGAMKTINKITGGTNVADAAAYCAKKHGLVEHTHNLMAKRGDLVVVENGGTLIAGVVHLNGRDVISVSEKGLVRIPVCDLTGKSNIIRAWSLDLEPVIPKAVDTSLPALPANTK